MDRHVTFGICGHGISFRADERTTNGENAVGETLAQQIDWDCIEAFIGYGARHAPIVFIGMEEGGTDSPDELAQDLVRRSSYDQVMEIKEGSSSRTWSAMCDFMLRRRDGLAQPNPIAKKNIWQQNLAARMVTAC